MKNFTILLTIAFSILLTSCQESDNIPAPVDGSNHGQTIDVPSSITEQ